MHMSTAHSTNCNPEDFSGPVERGNTKMIAVVQFLLQFSTPRVFRMFLGHAHMILSLHGSTFQSRSLLHCPSSQKATVIHPKVFQDKPKSLLCCHIQQTLLGISRPLEVLERQPPGTHTHAQKLKSYLPCPR